MVVGIANSVAAIPVRMALELRLRSNLDHLSFWYSYSEFVTKKVVFRMYFHT